MREIRSYGSVGVSAGNRRHYPALEIGFLLMNLKILGKRGLLNADCGLRF
jgi:hypothetical protein